MHLVASRRVYGLPFLNLSLGRETWLAGWSRRLPALAFNQMPVRELMARFAENLEISPELASLSFVRTVMNVEPLKSHHTSRTGVHPIRGRPHEPAANGPTAGSQRVTEHATSEPPPRIGHPTGSDQRQAGSSLPFS